MLKSGMPRNLMLAVLLVAAVLVVAGAVFLQQRDKSPQTLSAEGIPYINTDGTVGYQLNATDIDQAYFALTPYLLDSSGPSEGWYFVKGNITLTNPLTISGDVHLIIGDGFTLTVTRATNNVIVTSGSLSFYAQSERAMGRIVVTDDNGISLASGCGLVNTASITSASPNGHGVHASGTAAITNGVTGIIRGGSDTIMLEAGGTVNNLGLITTTGAFAYGIQTLAYADVTNSGRIQSNYRGILLDAGGVIENSGTIIGTDHGVEVENHTADITNKAAGTIEGGGGGISLGRGGTVNNSGMIRCTDLYSDGIYASNNVMIINSGIIQGTWSGVDLTGGGTVENFGTIRSADINGNGIAASGTAVTIFNTGLIQGGACSIRLDAGGAVDNFGRIVSADANGNAVEAGHGTAPVTLINTGTITGSVSLPDLANDITFMAGSKIDGDFRMGTNAGSKLTFAGVLDSSLQYSVIVGNADIGNAVIDIDGTGLPSSLVGGDTVILINASAGSVTDPANINISVGVYDFTLSVEDKQLVAMSPPNRVTPR